MRKADPSIQLIALGRQRLGRADDRESRASTFRSSPSITCSIRIDEKQPVLRGELYRRDAEATWRQLMKAWEINDRKIRTNARQPGAAPNAARR